MAKDGQRGTAETIDFGDQSITGGLTKRPDSYSAKPGRTDYVRVITMPRSYFAANVSIRGTDKGFPAPSLANHQDLMEMESDAAAKKRAAGACPLVARGYPLKRRFAVLLFWVGSEVKGKFKTKGEFIPWAFAGERYGQIRSIVNSLPASSADPARKIPLYQAELKIECTEERFQKMNIIPLYGEQRHSNWKEDIKPRLDEVLEDPDDLASACELVEDLIAPEDKASLVRSLDRAEGGGGDDDEFSAPRGGKKPRGDDPDPDEKPRGKKSAAQDEDDDLAKDLDDAMGDGLDDPEPDEKPRGKKPARDDDPEDDPDEPPARKAPDRRAPTRGEPDEKPRGKKPAQDDPEDEPPARSPKSPAKGGRKADPDED